MNSDNDHRQLPLQLFDVVVNKNHSFVVEMKKSSNGEMDIKLIWDSSNSSFEKKSRDDIKEAYKIETILNRVSLF